MRTLLALALASFTFSAFAQAVQTPAPQAPAPNVTVAQEVERLAPQLVAFAGSRGNFESLVTGLALGVPVTLTTVDASGLVQTTRFALPGGAQTDAVQIARTLETARQQLISQGVATPSAQQLGELISGTTVPVTVTTVPPGLAPNAPGPQAPGAAGGTVPSPAAQIQQRSIPDAPRTNTSDSRNLGSTSASPVPPASGALGPQVQPPASGALAPQVQPAPATSSPALPARPAIGR